MPFSVSGFVLEPVRVGQSNSPFTYTPNNYISDPSAFNTAYPTDESTPRADYLVLVTSEGTPNPGLLVNAKFGWTKNEVINRFDYAGRDGRFQPLPGGEIVTAGTLGPGSNTTRLKVPTPIQVLAAAPFRLSLGLVGSGVTFTTALVPSFGAPSPGNVEILKNGGSNDGELNWNAADLVTFNGQVVRFQQQQFFGFDKSTGRIGVIGDPVILLNPIPGTGQIPLLRFGYSLYLQTVEVPNEGSFTTPPSGTVQWALTTGRLHFNPSDVTTNTGIPLYYEGVLFSKDLMLPRQSIGTVSSPTPIVGLPPSGGDIIFALLSATPYYQFPHFSLVSSFSSPGKLGTVQIDPGTGNVQFSNADQSKFGSAPVEVIFGDLPIDHGVSLRLFRTPVDLDASQPTVKDVTAIYDAPNSIWSSPIIGSPQVFLPSVPIDDLAYPLTVRVEQGQGTFTGTLPRLDVPSPPSGIGYFIDFDARTLHYAQRKNLQLVPITSASGAVQLPDPLILSGNLTLELETGEGTGVYNPLTIGSDVLVDETGGIVNFTSVQGTSVAEGTTASFSGTAFTDPSADFVLSGVQPGDLLVVEDTAAKGVYTVATVVGATSLTTDVVAQTPSLTGAPTPISVTNVAYSIDRGKEILADRFFQEVSLIDPHTSVERIRALGVGQNATTIVSTQTATFPDFLTLNDSGTDFLLSGVQIGDTVLILSGPDSGSTRSITFVAQHQLTVSSTLPFVSLTSETYSITRRLNIPVEFIGVSRFRFGSAGGSFSSSVVSVPNDSSFTSPSLLPAGTVEVSEETGNLNFSSSDIGSSVYWSKVLTQKVDYILSAGLGLIQFTDRLLALEEILVTYITAPPNTDPPTPPGSPIQEYATFLVRKEVTQPHPTPTSVLTFNPLGRPVASNPPPSVFRGGRPQVLGVQCTVDIDASTITFLTDSQITDALPHGATINPNERVYIDYYVTSAIGGEKTTTVLFPPIFTVSVNIQAGSNSFTVQGNHTSDFPPNTLLRIENQEVYFIGSSSFDGGTNLTTVTLFGNQIFQNTFSDPKLFVTSGQTRITSVPFFPAYFVPEVQGFDPIARGMNKILITGDRTKFYSQGVVLMFTDGLSTFTDFLEVTGALYNEGTNRTEVTLSSPAIRQYIHGLQFLNYSIRPVFEDATSNVVTIEPPVLTQPITVFRRREGDAGLLLVSPTDYSIDASGNVKFTTTLLPAEEFGILYTGHTIVQPGPRLRASYTCTIAPTDSNGLLGQILEADYFILSPDNFYYRVETLTNFKGEVAQEIQADSTGSPSSGPMTSNTAQPQLFDQGRESLYFQEGHLANEDIVARASLKFYNDTINDLEDALQDMDGRVVGNQDGRFIYDGTTGAQHPPGPVTNQIDDVIKISNAPYTITFPPFAVTSIGTFEKYYLPGPLSRFFPTAKNFFGVSSTGVKTGDEILDTGSKNLTQVSDLKTRLAWAIITSPATAGSTDLFVDNADGSATIPDSSIDIARPPLLDNMKCVIQKRDGTFVNDETSPVTITVLSTTHLQISGLAGPVLPGYTIYRSPSDDSTQTGVNILTYYSLGRDYGFNKDSGQITYVKPFPPLDGSVPAVPAELRVHPIPAGQAISGNLTLSNTETEPFTFPALVGETVDDDGDTSFPVLSPSFDCEFKQLLTTPTIVTIGHLADEEAIIKAGGTLRTATTAPLVSTGNLDVTKTIITNVPGPFSAPIPKVHDLVRILSGLNGTTSFRRVTVVGANTITVDTAFVSQDSGFTYEVTVSSLAVTGTATFPSTTHLQDGLATFTSTAKIGYTVVGTSGPNNKERRQIVTITDDQNLVLDQALPSLTGGTYRIDNPLGTFGGAPGGILDNLANAVSGEISVYSTNSSPANEIDALMAYFNSVFTNIFVSLTGQTTATLTTLTDTLASFVTDGVTSVDYVFIRSGSVQGIYQVANVLSQTQLQVDSATPFPATATNVNYRVVKVFGASKASLLDVFNILVSVDPLVLSAGAFYNLITTPVAVVRSGVPDPTAFARATLVSDLIVREITTSARIAYVTNTGSGPVAKLESILASTDKLYDTRSVWVDARINLETGLIVKQARAVSNRIKAQKAILKQLIKLLAVEGS